MMPTSMPVINTFLKNIHSHQLFKNTLFVCVQHLLYTTIDLFDALIYLGANPKHIFLSGKVYSTHPHISQILIDKDIQLIPNEPLKQHGTFTESLKKDIGLMWKKIQKHLISEEIDKIIILDDGGLCLTNTPIALRKIYPVIGVEQTSSGLFHARNAAFPVIEVASSAAKQYLEAPMIAQAIEAKLTEILPLACSKCLRCGVVGLGVIGKAVVNKLLQYGHTVYTYDDDPNKNISLDRAQRVNNINDILILSDYIFGCTGKDVFKGVDFENSCRSSKVLISCSSQDIEFHSLLNAFAKSHHADSIDPLATTHIKLTDTVSIKILRGGFPVNLDNSGYSVPSCDIQMTRGLLLAGCVQAASLIHHYSPDVIPHMIMLCPSFQHLIVKKWFSLDSYCATQNPFQFNFANIDWIRQHSGGEFFSQPRSVNPAETASCQIL